MLLEDTLSKAEIAKCQNFATRSFNIFERLLRGTNPMTGANALDIAQLAADQALLTSNATRLGEAYNKARAELQLMNTTRADGIRSDGSFSEPSSIRVLRRTNCILVSSATRRSALQWELWYVVKILAIPTEIYENFYLIRKGLVRINSFLLTPSRADRLQVSRPLLASKLSQLERLFSLKLKLVKHLRLSSMPASGWSTLIRLPIPLVGLS